MMTTPTTLRMTGPMGLVVTSRSRLRRIVLARNSPPETSCRVMWATASLQAPPPAGIRRKSAKPAATARTETTSAPTSRVNAPLTNGLPSSTRYEIPSNRRLAGYNAIGKCTSAGCRGRPLPPRSRLAIDASVGAARGWQMMLPGRPPSYLPRSGLHLPGQPAQAAPEHELEGRAHQPEAEPSRPPERQVQVLQPHQPRAPRSGPDLEAAGAPHDPAEMGDVDPPRRIPADDLHRVVEADPADPGEGIEPLAEPATARLDGHGREHHPPRLALPVGERRPRHIDRRRHGHPLLDSRSHPVLPAMPCRMMVPCNGPSDGAPSTSPERSRSWRSSTAPRTRSTTAGRISRSTPRWQPPSGRSPRERTGWTWAASKQAPAPRSTRPRSWSACCRWSRRCDLGPTR